MVDAEVTVKEEAEGAGTANVDTKSLIGVGGKTVHRQITIIGSPSVFGQTAEVNAAGELLVKHTDAIPVTDNAGSLTVDGSVSISGTALVDVTDEATRDLGKVDVAGLDQYTPQDVDTGAPTVNALPIVLKKSAAGAPDLGTSTDPIRTDPTGTTTQPISGTVSVTEPVSVDDNAASLTVDNPTASSLKNEPAGNVAHDAIDSGNPIKVGGQARTTNPTAVADADRVNAIFDKVGRQIVTLQQVRELIAKNTITLSTTTETSLLAAGAAGVFHDIVLLTIANTSATATRVDFRDVLAGAVIFSLYVPAGATVGFSTQIPVPQTTAASAWTAQLGTAVTDVRIFVQGVKNV